MVLTAMSTAPPGSRFEAGLPPVAGARTDLETVLRRIAEILRSHCGEMAEPELDRLASRLFETSARFVLAWVED
jgi:hypothetical protein